MTELVTIRTYYDWSDAVVAKSLLEAHGIYAIIPDWHTTTNAWHYMNALHGIRICSFDVDATAAHELLYTEKEVSITLGPLRTKDLVVAVLAFVLAGIPHPVRRRRLR